MNRHALTYIDLHPRPIEPDAPSPLALVAGAALAVALVFVTLWVLFSL